MRSAKAFQDGVARGMSRRVVDLLQAVEVQHHEGEWTVIARGAADFLGQSLLAGAAIVEPRQLIERGKFVDLRGEGFDFRKRGYLIRDLVAHADEQRLLIHEINAEEQNDSDQRAHRLIQIKRGSRILFQNCREGEGGHRKREQN